MSQKKLKKLRRLETAIIKAETANAEPVKGVRQILKENWKFLLLMLVGIVALYLNGMHGDFVSDDYASILNNPQIKDFKYGVSGLLVGLSNWFLAVTFGVNNTIPFHVLNLIMYLMVCVLGFIFLYVVFDRKVAWLSIILFAVLPIHVEAVSWVSGKPYLFTSVTVLSELISFILYLKTGAKKYLWFFIALLPITFLAERVRSLSLVFLIPLFIFSFGNKLAKKVHLGKIILILLSVMVVFGVALWPLISFRITNVNSGYNGSGGLFYNPFFQYPTAVAKYLQMALLPADLTLYHTMYIFPIWLNWMIFLTYLGVTGYFFFKDKKIFFALAFIFLATAPSMAPVKVSWLVAERYLLLGSLGFCAFLVLFFLRLGKKFELPLFILFILALGYYGARVLYRNDDWKTNHKLWVNTCQVSPNSHNAWNNIGDDYDKLAQLETTDEGKMKQYYNAIKGFTRSTMVKTDYADAFHNRGNIYYKIGRYDLASDSYETALYFGPNLYQSYFSLIQIDLITRRYDLAMNHLNKLNGVRPNDPQVYYVAAVVYANMGQKDQAIKILEQVLTTSPNYPDANRLLEQLKSMK